MNVLFLYPPQWMPISPHYAIPSLMGQFEGSEHNVCAMDINLDFYCEILTKKNIQDALKKARELEKTLFDEISKFYVRTKAFETYPEEQKNKMAKHVMIKTFLQKYQKDVDKIPVLIEGAIGVLRNKKYFYNPKLLL